MSISIEEHSGHNNVPEGRLRALVTRTTEPGPLAELARGFGDAEGANLGVSVAVNHETGAVTGSVMQLYGEDNAVILKAVTAARHLWDKVDRTLSLTMTIRVIFSRYS